MYSLCEPHFRAVAAACLLLGSVAAGGCLGGSTSGFFSGGDQTSQVSEQSSSTTAMTPEEQAALYQLVGPSYCPRVVVTRGGEAIREFAEGHEGDPGHIVWQATISNTARQCRYDLQGSLDIKIGVSGRLLVGPDENPGNFTLPVVLTVEKYREATLFSETYQVEATVGPEGSMVFRKVFDISVPSPGRDRDYIIEVGFPVDEGPAADETG